MVTTQDLIQDEYEAISGYAAFINSHHLTNFQLIVIRKIISDENKHVKMLHKIKNLVTKNNK